MKPMHETAHECDESLILVSTSSGQYILFRDDLVYGGPVEGVKTKVSFEMTVLIRG